jgi:hypothetical protein
MIPAEMNKNKFTTKAKHGSDEVLIHICVRYSFPFEFYVVLTVYRR